MTKGRLKGSPADFDDYEEFLHTSHLQKFSAKEVGFVDPSPSQEHCHTCYHWFINQASGWTPCEIMTLGNKTPVPGSGVCRFFTGNGKSYPLLDTP